MAVLSDSSAVYMSIRLSGWVERLCSVFEAICISSARRVFMLAADISPLVASVPSSVFAPSVVGSDGLTRRPAWNTRLTRGRMHCRASVGCAQRAPDRLSAAFRASKSISDPRPSAPLSPSTPLASSAAPPVFVVAVPPEGGRQTEPTCSESCVASILIPPNSTIRFSEPRIAARASPRQPSARSFGAGSASIPIISCSTELSPLAEDSTERVAVAR